jgi:hypothetical protein
MVESNTAGVVVVGVQSGQAHDVVGVAAAVAERFSAPMVCVVVDPALLSAGMRADGSEIIEPIDPDTADSDPQQLPDDDVRVIHGLAAARSVGVEILSRVGDPGRALAAVADVAGLYLSARLRFQDPRQALPFPPWGLSVQDSCHFLQPLPSSLLLLEALKSSQGSYP